MAELLFSRSGASSAVACSAGVAPWEHLHPMAARLLQERGIDTSGRRPTHVQDLQDADLSWVVTIGDRARNEIPRFTSNPTILHWGIFDPAEADGTGREEKAFRRALAMIEERLPEFCAMVEKGVSAPEMHLEPGLSTCIVRPDRFDPATHLPLFASAGFSCIELNCFIGSDDFPWDRAGRVKELADVAKDTGVRVYSVHAEGGLGACSGPRSERMAVDLFRSFADLAAELGAPLVTIHGDLPRDTGRGAAQAQLRVSLETLARHVHDMPCAFGWENLLGQGPEALSPEDHLSWIRELGQDAFGLVLDTGHANIVRTANAYIDGCEGLLTGLHLNDNNGSGDQHRAPGKGNVAWKGFVNRLLKAGYTGPLMLEIVGVGEKPRDLREALAEARASIDFLQDVRSPVG